MDGTMDGTWMVHGWHNGWYMDGRVMGHGWVVNGWYMEGRLMGNWREVDVTDAVGVGLCGDRRKIARAP